MLEPLGATVMRAGGGAVACSERLGRLRHTGTELLELNRESVSCDLWDLEAAAAAGPAGETKKVVRTREGGLTDPAAEALEQRDLATALGSDQRMPIAAPGLMLPRCGHAGSMRYGLTIALIVAVGIGAGRLVWPPAA